MPAVPGAYQAQSSAPGTGEEEVRLARRYLPPGAAEAIPPSPPPPLAQPSIPAKSKNAGLDIKELNRHKEAADALYDRSIRTVKELFRSLQAPPPQLYRELRSISEEMLRQIQEGNPYISINTRYSTAGNYFYAHSVNVATLSLILTGGLGWSEEDRIQLGTAALLHEVGMSRFLHLVQASRELTSEERKEIRLHPLASQELLKHIQDMETSLKGVLSEIVVQVHERTNGSGYPRGLGRDQINLGAQILGLCDIYEALSHARNWRAPFLPHDAIKLMLRENSEEFDRPLLKALLEQLSLYPPGSYVQLSTHEIGRVLQVNKSFPTRPLVEIRIRADGTREDPPKIVDLLQHPLIHVGQAVDETRIAVKDPKLRLQFEASRWWTD